MLSTAIALLVHVADSAKLLVVDTRTEKVLAELAPSGDVDEAFLDVSRNRAHAACGAGFVDVFARGERGGWSSKGRVATAAGARTCLIVCTERRVNRAEPHRGEQRAQVRIREVTG